MRRVDGFVLPLTLMLMVAITLLVLTTTVLSLSDHANARNDRSAAHAELVAKAGYHRYKTTAFQSFRYYQEYPERYATEAARYAQCGNLMAIGLDLDRDGTFGGADLWSENRSLSEPLQVGDVAGTYTVSYSVIGPDIVLRSVGEAAGGRATVQGVLRGQNASTLSNALFAGRGQAGAHINGGVDVYGSVYVEGSGHDDTVIDANGNFQQHNNYTKAQLATLTGLAEAELQLFLKTQALEQKDLCSQLRVKQGKIKVGGNTTVGAATSPNSEFEGRLAGVHVGSSAPYDVNTAVQVTGSAVIHSQTSPGPFDLDPAPEFPLLDGYNVDMDELPANVQNALVGTVPSWRQSMRTDAALNGMLIQGTGVAPHPPSGCDLNSVLDSGKVTLTFGATSITCLVGAPQRGFKYTYDAALDAGVLEIRGMLDLQGLNLVFQKNVVVRYEGKASMLVERVGGKGGNVTIAGDVLPYQSFPDRDVLGIMAEDNLTITGDSQQEDLGSLTKTQVVMGMFYAQQKIAIAKSAVMMGTMLGNQIDASTGSGGGGKAKMIQVPGLEYNLPPGFASLNNTSNPTFAVYSYERK